MVMFTLLIDCGCKFLQYSTTVQYSLQYNTHWSVEWAILGSCSLSVVPINNDNIVNTKNSDFGVGGGNLEYTYKLICLSS